MFGVNTVTVLTCPDCGALGLDCEPSSEDEALYNCPKCGFYKTYEIGSEDDWQEAENELEEEWIQVQSLSTDSPGVAAVVEYLRENPPSTADVRNQQFVHSGWSPALDQLEDLLVDEETPDLVNYRSVDDDMLRVAHAVGPLRTLREVESAVENDQLGEAAVEKLQVQIRKRKRAMKALDSEIRGLEQIIDEVEKGGGSE